MIFRNPVSGVIAPTSSGTGFRMTQDFGPTSLSAEPKVVWPGGEGIPAKTYLHFHKGIDLSNRSCGATVYAMAAGKVRVSYKTSAGENIVVLDHGNGWCTSYGHMASRSVVKGATVTEGQKIGTVGSTGNSTGCHLHVGLKDRVPDGANYYLSSTGRMLDAWRRLRQNVRVRPAQGVSGVNLREGTAISSKAVARVDGMGAIIRVADGIEIGAASVWYPWAGSVEGGEYMSPSGATDRTWEGIKIDGMTLWVAHAYAERSA